MGFQLSQRSLDNLASVHPDLVRVVKRAIEITPVDFTVIEGIRSLERQRELVASGASRTMNSRHLTGHAVDIVPLDERGNISWDWPLYHKLAPAIKQAARECGVPIEWGGDWKTLKDGPHWQLPWKHYPATVRPGMENLGDPYTDKTERRAAVEEAAATGTAGAVGAAAACGDEIIPMAQAISDQQAELASGDWVRIAVAVVILGLTLFAIWRRIRR